MVRPLVFRLTLASIAWLAAVSAQAGPITFTGDAERDFNPLTNRDVVVVVDNPRPDGSSDPDDVFGSRAEAGREARVSGWNIKDLRFAYDRPSDTMFVAVNTFGIAGDSDGNGNPATYTSPFLPGNPRLGSDSGEDTPNLGREEAIVVGFDFDRAEIRDATGTLRYLSDVVAGVPSVKPSGVTDGISTFTVARVAQPNSGTPDDANFGPTLTGNLGRLAFNPSAANPDFEFTVTNFSSLGVNFEEGFRVKAYAGSGDLNFGEDTMVAGFPVIIPQVIPEPTTVLAWTLLAGGALWHVRRHRRTAQA